MVLNQIKNRNNLTILMDKCQLHTFSAGNVSEMRFSVLLLRRFPFDPLVTLVALVSGWMPLARK